MSFSEFSSGNICLIKLIRKSALAAEVGTGFGLFEGSVFIPDFVLQIANGYRGENGQLFLQAAQAESHRRQADCWGAINGIQLRTASQPKNKPNKFFLGDGEAFVEDCMDLGIEFEYAVALRKVLIETALNFLKRSSLLSDFALDQQFKAEWDWNTIKTKVFEVVNCNKSIRSIVFQNYQAEPKLQFYCHLFNNETREIPQLKHEFYSPNLQAKIKKFNENLNQLQNNSYVSNKETRSLAQQITELKAEMTKELFSISVDLESKEQVNSLLFSKPPNRYSEFKAELRRYILIKANESYSPFFNSHQQEKLNAALWLERMIKNPHFNGPDQIYESTEYKQHEPMLTNGSLGDLLQKYLPVNSPAKSMSMRGS